MQDEVWFTLYGNHHQMTIDECIFVATTGSDGRPAVGKGGQVMFDGEAVYALAYALADEAVERVAHDHGRTFGDGEYEKLVRALQEDFAEAIHRRFAGA